MKISGKTFVITGGASGLGYATLKHLYSLGANLIIFDINQDAGELLVKEFGQDRIDYYCIDVTNEDQIKKSLNSSLYKFKEIHGAITCAGIVHSPIPTINNNNELFPLDLFIKTLNVNTIGTFNTIRLVGSIINKQSVLKDDTNYNSKEKGVIIMVSSTLYNEGQVGQIAYCASKGAIASMTLPLAREFASLSIRVMTIAPGLMDTPMVAGYSHSQKKENEDGIPFPSRMGRPSEFALLCQQIIENPYLNGEIIRLDGGLRANYIKQQ